MPNTFFKFKQFTIHQDKSAMKVTTDACLFGSWVAAEIKNLKPRIKNILDIGSGTGLLSLMLAQKIPAAIDAIELDKNTYEQAKENIAISPWASRINIIHADARSYHYVKTYDLIISNPPFYEKEIKASDEKKNLAHHSEELTLKDLLSIIKTNLSSNGKFFLLLPYKRNREVSNLFKQHDIHLDKVIFVRQSHTHDFFRIIIEGKMNREEMTETAIDEISIWDEEKEYTAEFTELLKEYYLNL
jgi:tRNA1Val (adenine37-N6)-methyltransferase